MRDLTIAITAASYSGNKGAAAMLQSSISQLKEIYGDQLKIRLMSVYPSEDRLQCPHDCVSIVPAQPQRIVFAAFPCAVLYRLFSWCPPLRALLLRSPILNTYAQTDLVIDEAGIAFSDSRGFVMNTYAFMCAAVPLLMGVPIVKYSQAMGPFHNGWNRFLAKWILPKADLVIARGRLTREHLHEVGIDANVKLCADGAFSMPENPAIAQRVQNACARAGFTHTVGLSISSVVARRCAKAGIDYCDIMVKFILYLNKRGFKVYMFANAARIRSKRPRNNDLMIGDAIAEAYRQECKRASDRTCGASGGKKGSDERQHRAKMHADQGQHCAKTYADQRRHCAKIRGDQRRDCLKTYADRRQGVQEYVGSSGLIWEHREMEAEEIRAYIGQCELVVASRFHAMVFALSRQVPVMLIGWSHKYREVMEQFGLGEYAADYKHLSEQQLQQSFENLIEHQDEIREKIAMHLPDVTNSSKQNITYIAEIIDRILGADCPSGMRYGRKIYGTKKMRTAAGHMDRRKRIRNHVIDLDQPDFYIGPYRSCQMGYAQDKKIRENAASGGLVTALLCSLLKNNEIDGAWVVKTAFRSDGRLTYDTYIAKTPQQVCEASSSVYMHIPMMRHIDQLRRFDGRLAVVLTPCMMQAFCRILEKDDLLRLKVVLKIGLFCSGAHKAAATEYALDKYRIPRSGAQRLYYRRGHWRGRSGVLYHDGTSREFSYTKSICAYKNAYFFVEKKCLSCKDQFAARADISFGDVWLSEVKKDPIKYTGCIIRSEKAEQMIKRAQKQGDLYIRDMSADQMLRSQMRALTFKYRGDCWNHRLAGFLAVKNRELSVSHPDLLKRIPMPVVYYYMCMIRVLLSW